MPIHNLSTLMQALGIKSDGASPDSLGGEVAPGVDVSPFLFLERLTRARFSFTWGNNYGQVLTTVPNDENWIVIGSAVDSSLAVSSSLEMYACVGIRKPNGDGLVLLADHLAPWASGTAHAGFSGWSGMTYAQSGDEVILKQSFPVSAASQTGNAHLTYLNISS